MINILAPIRTHGFCLRLRSLTPGTRRGLSFVKEHTGRNAPAWGLKPNLQARA